MPERRDRHDIGLRGPAGDEQQDRRAKDDVQEMEARDEEIEFGKRTEAADARAGLERVLEDLHDDEDKAEEIVAVLRDFASDIRYLLEELEKRNRATD